MIINRQKTRHYFWSVLGVIGIVFFWAGLWDGIGNLYWLQNPLVSLAAGVMIILVSGLVFKKFDFLKKTKLSTLDLVSKVHSHPKKHEFHIGYKDKLKKKTVVLPASKLKDIEKSFLVLVEDQKEKFVPLHRIKKILHKGKPWRGADVKKK